VTQPGSPGDPPPPPAAAGDSSGHRGVTHDRETLDRSLVRGVAWTGSMKWLTQVATWGATLVVARVLSPTDYGIVGMAAVYFGLLTMVSESGFGMTVIARREVQGRQLLEVHTVAAMAGVIGFAVSAVVAPLLVAFFDAPELRWVVMAMSVNFFLISLRTVPQATLQRQLEFKRYAIIDGANSIITAVASIALALAGFRYWSLVISAILGSLVATILALSWQPMGFRRPHFGQLRDVLRTSRELVGASLAWYVSQSADFFVAGRMLGKPALGAYTLAWNLAYSIVEKVTTLVNGVTSSIFSAAKHDRALLTRYITRIMGVLSLVLLPATAGVALIARELVMGVLGSKWEAAVAPLIVLVLYAGVRSLVPILSQALAITGDTRYTMRRNIIGAICLPIGFVIGARWGIVGIATAWIVVHAPVVLFPQLRRVSKHLGIRLRDYLPAIMPAIASTAIMSVAVLSAAMLIPAQTPLVVVLVAKVAIGGVAYAGAVWLLFRDRVVSLVRAVSHLRQSAPAPTSTPAVAATPGS
jgi:teichuronic acid exporter